MDKVEKEGLAPIRQAASGELLLELLSEEIPARMQRRAIDDLVALLRDKLAAAEIPAASGSVSSAMQSCSLSCHCERSEAISCRLCSSVEIASSLRSSQ